jgi:hypothetical protein
LDELPRGATVEITDSDGRTHSFAVRGRTVIAKGQLDADLFAFSPEPEVLLVTCSGPIDPNRGLRSENLLVLATIEQPRQILDGT